MTGQASSQRAVAVYLDAVRLWRAEGGQRAPELIDAAVGCLSAGVSYESIAELAGEAATPCAPTRDDLEPLVRRTTDDLGAVGVWREPVQGAALEVMVRRVLDGAIEPWSLAEWAYSALGWDADARAQPFVELGAEACDVVGQDLATAVRLEAQLFDVESRFSEVATVHRGDLLSTTLDVVPFNPRARAIWLHRLGTEILIQAGDVGGRWELRRTAEEVAFLIDLVESIVAGRVRERIGPQRSRVEVTLADGSVAVETGYRSLLPAPGWRRWARLVEYEPYVEAARHREADARFEGPSRW